MRALALTAVLTLCACTSPMGSTACTECAGACVETLSDSDNCGTCGNACAAGTRCENGTCVVTCSETTCGNACVDLQSDPLNCGACANACAMAHAGAACVAGLCSHAPCDEGWSDCDFDVTNGCETPAAVCYQSVCGTFPDGGPHSCYLIAANIDATRVLVSSTDDFGEGGQDGVQQYLVVTPATHAAQRIALAGLSDAGIQVEGVTLSGDGSTAAFWVYDFTDFSEHMRVVDVSTDATSEIYNDGGFALPQPGSPMLSYDGRYLAVSGNCDLTGDSDFVACVARYDLTTGAPQVAYWNDTPIFACQMSGDGQIITLLSQFASVETIDMRDTDAGFMSVLDSFDGGEQLFEPTSLVLSFDGGVIAFAIPPPDGASASEIFVVKNGSLVATQGLGPAPISGAYPTLSNDGRVLAVDYFSGTPGACYALDLVTGAPLEIGDPQFVNCFGTLSGDGRSLLTIDSAGISPAQIRIVRVNRP